MADVQIASGVSGVLNRGQGCATTRTAVPIWTSPTTGYVFILNSSNDLYFYKTTNGGQSWSATLFDGTPFIWAYSVWYEGWSPGDAGTKIGVAYYDPSTDIAYFRTLDTATDTIGTRETALSGGMQWFTGSDPIWIGKTRNGEWIVCGIDSSSNLYFRKRSTGGTWSNLAATVAITSADTFLFVPGNSADADDFWFVWFDVSANTIYQSWWDASAGSWTHTTIRSSASLGSNTPNGDVAILSDGSYVVVTASTWLTSPSTLHAYIVTGNTSVASLSDVVSVSNEHFGVGLLADQQTDDVYVGYAKDGYTSSQTVCYKKGTRSGGSYSWGIEQAMSENAAGDFNPLRGGVAVGDAGGRWEPAWSNSTTVKCNYNNSVELAAAGGGSFIDNTTPILLHLAGAL